MGLPHVIRCRITIKIHGGSDVGVPHHPLLHSNWRAGRIQP